ncbi:MAG: T9SS type A sorting domain-containing protein [Bacteroidales bacterium]|nr:T9SS type A sorting domain-containing protein [Bacteroidales bacterium]
MKTYIFPGIALIFCSIFFYSTLSGQSQWYQTNPSPPLVDFTDIQFVSDQSGWVVGENGTLLRTTNAGLNWEQHYLYSDQDLFSVHFLDEMTGWVGGKYYSLYKTNNGGTIWEKVTTNLYKISHLQFINEAIGWATYNNKIYKTINGGWNFELCSDALEGDAINLVFTSENYGFAISELSEFIRTIDGGENWEVQEFYSAYSVNDLYFLNDNEGWVSTSDGRIFKTTDFGATWETLYVNTTEEIRNIHFYTSEHGIAITRNSCHHTYNGGETWSAIPFSGNYYAHVDGFTDNGIIALIAEDDGSALISADYGNSWTLNNSSTLLDLFTIGQASDQRLVVAGENGVIICSEDMGLSWQGQNSNTTKDILDVCFSSENKGWAVGNQVLLYTNDGGDNWEEKDVFTFYIMRSVFSINDDIIYCSGDNGRVYKTVDGGENWVEIYPQVWEVFNDIYFLDENTGFIAGEGGKCLKTTNGGSSWINIETNLFTEIYCVYFKDSIWGWLGSANGLFYTNDGGNSWQESLLNNQSLGPIRNFQYINDTNLWVSKQSQLLHSMDGGISWTKCLEITNDYIYDMIFIEDDFGIAVGRDGIILKTEDLSYLAPGIITEIDDTIACADNSFFVSANAIGNDLHYQWYQSDSPLPNTDTSKLVFANIHPENGGFYRYEVFNEAGIQRSGVFSITVKTAAVVLASPPDSTIFETDTIQFQLAVTGALPILYQWQKNGEDIPGANYNVYPIYGVQLSDSGYYQCIVWNECNIDTTDAAYLTVLPASAINEKKFDFQLKVSPNPVLSFCRVEFDQLIKTGAYSIFSLKGEKVKHGSISHTSLFEIDVSLLKPGIYLLAINNGDCWKSTKFLKIME